MTNSPPQLLWLNPADLEVDSDNAALFEVERTRVERLKASMQRLGFRSDRPIVVRQSRRKGMYRVVDGWHRALAAQELGLPTIPVVMDPSLNKSGDPPAVITSNLILNQLSRRLPQGQRLVLVYLLSLVHADPTEADPESTKGRTWWSLAGVNKTTWLHAKKYVAQAVLVAREKYPDTPVPDLLVLAVQDRDVAPDVYDLYHGKLTLSKWWDQASGNQSSPRATKTKKLVAALRDYLQDLLANTPVDARFRDRAQSLLELPANSSVNDHDAHAHILELCRVTVDLLRRRNKQVNPAPQATTLPLFSFLSEDSHPHDHSESAA